MNRIFVLSALALLSPGAFFSAPARAGSFTVIDNRAPDEISEISRLYLDGSLVAEFRLGPAVAEQTREVQTPLGRVNHDYALCGEITIVNAEGRHETHQVSSAGTLRQPDGHTFEALGSQNFTEFYLRDLDDEATAQHSPGKAAVCASPIT